MNFFNQLTSHQWEYFASYYFSSFGYTILQPPSVGQDQGKDLIVQRGNLKSLISCKHFAGSQRAVLAKDESSVLDRLVQHDAQQFIGFYSTKAGDSLKKYLETEGVNYLIFEGEAIFESMTDVSFSVHQSLFRNIQVIKAKVFGQKYRPLTCKCGCGTDLLSAEFASDSLVYLVFERNEIEIVWLIKGHNYGTSKEIFGVHSIDKCFSLIKLNEVIDEHDKIINNATVISKKFDEEYCLFLETIHQMIHPMEQIPSMG